MHISSFTYVHYMHNKHRNVHEHKFTSSHMHICTHINSHCFQNGTTIFTSDERKDNFFIIFHMEQFPSFLTRCGFNSKKYSVKYFFSWIDFHGVKYRKLCYDWILWIDVRILHFMDCGLFSTKSSLFTKHY